MIDFSCCCYRRILHQNRIHNLRASNEFQHYPVDDKYYFPVCYFRKPCLRVCALHWVIRARVNSNARASRCSSHTVRCSACVVIRKKNACLLVATRYSAILRRCFFTIFRTVCYPRAVQGADKSLARPGRKQTTVTEDFDLA